VFCAEAAASSGPALAKSKASPEDERFMRMALDEARQGDYAFGCVITRDGAVIAHGHNLGKTNDDPTAHGEMVAIRRCLPITAAQACAAPRSTRPANRV
jgi:tRNA(adenine34) deaminase